MARTLGVAPSRPPTSQYMCIFIGLVRSVAFSHIIVAESIQAQIPGALKPVIQEAARWYLVARPGLWQVPAGNKRTHRADQTTTLWVRQLVCGTAGLVLCKCLAICCGTRSTRSSCEYSGARMIVEHYILWRSISNDDHFSWRKD